jgi:hypothetical protein
MMRLFRFWHRAVLPVLLLLAGSADAQQVGPMGADPSRARYAPTAASRAAQRRTAAISLPFFDDFALPLEGAPRADLWVQAGGTLVSNRFAINPPTRGAVTFDGLKADGTSYTLTVSGGSGTSNPNIFSSLDTLTSLPIDLTGLSAADSVYLSFALQVGSVIGPPSANGPTVPIYIDLQFRSSTGRWSTVPGWSGATRPQAATLPFRQMLIPITQAQYFYGNFQFRFLTSGLSNFSHDNWSLDYVRLDRNRFRRRDVDGVIVGDTIMRDVAISNGFDTITTAGLSNPLRRYTSMPVWQYNAAAAGSELNPQMGVRTQNLRPPLPLPTPWLGTVRDLATGSVLGNWGSNTTNLLSFPTRVTQLTGDATQAPIPLTPEAKRLRYSLVLSSQEPDVRTLPNDTISRDIELSNYYAYDDGTPEGVFFLEGDAGLPRFLAYRFEVNQPDQVQSVRLWPMFGRDQAARPVTIRVWADNGGQPSTTSFSTKTYTLPAGNSGPVELFFDQPVPVSGVFYVGFGQAVTPRILEYAFDLNSRIPADYIWVSNAAGTFAHPSPQGREQFFRGVVMLRPVMNNNILATSAPVTRDAAAFRLYPNPSRGSVSVEGPAFTRATVLDALGRTAWEQPAAQAGQRQLELGTLPGGVYIVRLALPNGSVATRRLVISQ